MARSLKRRAGVLAERAGLAAARLGATPPPLPLPLYDAYFGAMASRALVAACSTGLADALPGTPEELAERLDLDPLGVDVVLRARAARRPGRRPALRRVRLVQPSRRPSAASARCSSPPC